MISIIVYLGLMAGTIYLAVLYNSEVTFFLFYLEFILLLLEGGQLILRNRYIQIKCTFFMNSTWTGVQIPLELSVSGRKIPTGDMKLCMYYRKVGERKRYKYRCKIPYAVGRFRLGNQIKGVDSGCYEFSKLSVKLASPLGLLRWKKNVKLGQRLDVLPAVYPIPLRVSEKLRYFQGESDIYDSLRGGEDATEIFALREFQQGDGLKNIHWKMSAKADELMVKENGNPLACGVIVFLDGSVSGKGAASGKLHWKQKKSRGTEVFYSLAASVSFSLVEKECPHFVVWVRKKDQEMVRMCVRDEESLHMFLMTILGEELWQQPMDLRGTYAWRYPGETHVSEIVVRRNGQLMSEGMRYQVTGKNPDAEFGKIELRV